MTETQIQSSIIDYLQLLENQGKLWFTRLNNIPPVNKTPGGRITGFRRLPKGCKKGIPDIEVLIKSKLVGFEIKAVKGKQSEEQKEVEESFKKHGAEYFIVKSLEDAIEIVNRFI